MKERYRKKLERAYELEGLLLLALNKDKMPEGLEDLIEKKLEELMEEEASESGVPKETVKEEVAFYALEDDEDDYGVEPVVPRESDRVKADVEKKEKGDRKPPVFSINDRFLFIKETFGGDRSLFDRTVKAIAGMKDFDEARDYLIGEMGLNPEENGADQEFLSLIEAYFG